MTNLQNMDEDEDHVSHQRCLTILLPLLEVNYNEGVLIEGIKI